MREPNERGGKEINLINALWLRDMYRLKKEEPLAWCRASTLLSGSLLVQVSSSGWRFPAWMATTSSFSRHHGYDRAVHHYFRHHVGD